MKIAGQYEVGGQVVLGGGYVFRMDDNGRIWTEKRVGKRCPDCIENKIPH